MKDIVSLSISLPAPGQMVWNALTDPDSMRKWYFPMMDDFRPEPGFRTQFTVMNEGKQFVHIWKVTRADAPHLLAYTWKYGGYPGETLLEFELQPEGETTRLTLTHSNLLSFQPEVHPELSSKNFEAGWQGFMDALKAYLENHEI